MLDKAQAIRTIKFEFPNLVEEMEDETWKGLFHLEISCFARYTQSLIDTGKSDAAGKMELKRVFEIARQIYIQGDGEVRNGINVSYLENLVFTDQKVRRKWAFELMPEALKSGYRGIHKYLDDLFRKKDG